MAMYHAHFGLERGLFSEGIAAESAVFRTAQHDRLIGQFKLALASPSSSIVLQGPAGVGKTTLTSTALRASSTRLALAWLGGMATSSAELLELILVELGVNTLRTSRIERLQLWRQFLGEMRATDSRLFIVVERTEDLSHEVLHALDQLTAPDAAGNCGANLVMLGHPGIELHLAPPLLDSLRQRIRLRAELEPFTEAELQDYLRHQVACAGGHYDRIFAPGTVAALHRYTRGIARLANTLCESALDIAAAQQQTQLTAELVVKTAVSVLKLDEPARAAMPRAAAAAPEPRLPPTTASPPTTPVSATRTAAVATPATLVGPGPSVPPPSAAAPSAPSPVVAKQPAAAPVLPTPAATPTATVAPAAASSPPTHPTPQEAAAPENAARPAAPPSTAPAPVPPRSIELEYDGSATDVADVALADFPVLTDAVELPLHDALPKRSTRLAAAAPLSGAHAAPAASPAPAAATASPSPVPAGAAAAAAAPVATATMAPTAAAPKPAMKPVNRVETAYAASRPPAPKAPAAAPSAPPSVTPSAAAPPRAVPPLVPAAKPPAPAALEDPDVDDVLRQTQSMRAIAVAKSIDDLSEVDAETLFGDAGLDLVSAALASAADWSDDDVEPAAPAPAAPAPTPRAKPEVKKTAPPPEDDPFDFFGLGEDAPLELIDDSATLPDDRGRKSALR